MFAGKKFLAKLTQNCEICKRSKTHKNLSHRNLTKYNVTPKEMQILSRISNFPKLSSLESIIFGGGNSNIKWRPCLKAFLSILFRKIFKHIKSIISERKRFQNTQNVISFNFMYDYNKFPLMQSNI